MKHFRLLVMFSLAFLNYPLFAQTVMVKGKVTDESGAGLQGISVTVKGTTVGTSSGSDGSFSLMAPPTATLVLSGIGFGTKEEPIRGRNSVEVSLTKVSGTLDEVVVTALGIRRNRNQVAYAAQQVSGEEVSKTRTNNFINNLSGKVAGLELRQTNTLGGSTNVTLRGVKSITGNNQALFVVDGVPFDNSNTNSTDQVTGRGGYDYGNSAADINPDDIESITVLKGAAASALYGSRGSNGVILITTKKGARGLGITVNSGVSVGSIIKSTFAKYQKEYGGGYGPYYEDAGGYFLFRDPANGFAPVTNPANPIGRLVVPLSEDASYGGRFDPNLMVYQWNAFDPLSPNFGKATPWVAAANDPTTFFEKPVSFNNSVFVDGGSDKGSFKLGYTRNDDKGILPNSKVTKNLLNFGSTYNITKRLSAGGSINFSNIVGVGRYGTGYNDKNVAGNFRQWWQVNNDIKELKDAYFRAGQNVTWNPSDPTDLAPIYWDNPYFARYENFENDSRNRYFGNVNLNYKITDWLNILGRVSLDSYDELQEERQALGSVTTSQYSRYNRSYRETNYDLLINFDKDISKSFNVKALLGSNIRKQTITSISASTNGGLIVEKIYSLSNSANPVNAPVETDLRKEIDGVFAGATISYKNMLTLDGTLRRDAASTLPKGNNRYYYPSISGGFVFSKLLRTATWLTYGKLRANYAEVGADAPFYSTLDVYNIVNPFGSSPQASVVSTKNNPDLLPEKTKSTEIGLEVALLKSRAGFDISYYNAESFNQILPTTVSTSTGYSSKYLNAGTIINKGIELSAYGTPVQTKNFSWTINVNWTRNRNKVKSLFEGSSNLLLANFQGGVSINATLSEPFGTLRGQNFVYTADGQKTIQANGRYALSPTSNEVIGNPNPDWIGGVNNTLRYKNVGLSWLIDVRQGGDLFSLDLYYGLATGLYPETAGLNDLGNPSRNDLSNGGGFINPGVYADGKPNTTRVTNAEFGSYGYRRLPAAAFVYDASYVKLREVVLTYSLPKSIVDHIPGFKGIDFNLIGRNLWLIHKNLPYADPEETISSGNLQGYQSGAYPTTRSMAFNVKFKF